jgi:Domain of unknown function (DUF4169)
MADLINLRNARKQKAKKEKDKTAQANRVLHGAPKVLRKLSDAQKDQADQRFSGQKLEKPDGDN